MLDDPGTPLIPLGEEPPRAAYIHTPFCRHRCGYCNFTVIAGRDDLIDPFLAALDRELQRLARPREVDTLFFGGGTPTHLPPAALARMFALVEHWHPRSVDHETSVEANPNDLNDAVLECLAAAGVNRLSVGVQSFRKAGLEILERDHAADEVDRTLERARKVVRSLSLDLIFGVPGQTMADWLDDLDHALHSPIDHVSTYGLTWEKGTSYWGRLQRGGLQPVGEELEREMYMAAVERLTAAGFEHYEVSNFARPGFRCRHNETYWSARPYFAAGPGAARYVDGRREVNHRSTTTWIKRLEAGQNPTADSETLPPDDRAREWAVFGLRRLEGLDRELFSARSGRPLDELVGPALRKFVALGLLSDDGRRVKLTPAGLLVSDSMWPEFLNG